MNERIKALAEEAGIAVWGDAVYMYDPKDILDSTVMEKLAELIVAECVKLCEHQANDDEYDQYDMGMSVKAENIKTAIKQHFGVES